MEIDFSDTINEWVAYLIDMEKHTTISMINNADKTKLIADIIRDNWFKSNDDYFRLFIEDILKY